MPKPIQQMQWRVRLMHIVSLELWFVEETVSTDTQMSDSRNRDTVVVLYEKLAVQEGL